MFAPDDTIAAIATPPGRGGIGVVRISGPRAEDVARAIVTHRGPLEARYATFTRVAAAESGARPDAPGTGASIDIRDEVVVTFYPQPHSYTGQDVVEISAHGSPVVLQGILERALAAGARLAEPGEFTLRAFLNGKRDLIQAEAVADLVDAVTPLQARTAFDQLEGTLTARIASIDGALFDLIARLEASLDFPDEGYHFIEPSEIVSKIDDVLLRVNELLADAGRGRLIREGALVVIAGRPNVGKSSLFNALAGAERAIVTEVPGTTRDLLTERVNIGGLAITLVDTAGTRDTLDVVEREGVSRADRAREVADLVLVVLEAGEVLQSDDERVLARTQGVRRIIVHNKVDRHLEATSTPPSTNADEPHMFVSATSKDGLQELQAAIVRALSGGDSHRDTAAISNVRHIELLGQIRSLLQAARATAAESSPEELVLADLLEARQRFEEVVGRRTTDDVLTHIFERFCIGK